MSLSTTITHSDLIFGKFCNVQTYQELKWTLAGQKSYSGVRLPINRNAEKSLKSNAVEVANEADKEVELRSTMLLTLQRVNVTLGILFFVNTE